MPRDSRSTWSRTPSRPGILGSIAARKGVGPAVNVLFGRDPIKPLFLCFCGYSGGLLGLGLILYGRLLLLVAILGLGRLVTHMFPPSSAECRSAFW